MSATNTFGALSQPASHQQFGKVLLHLDTVDGATPMLDLVADFVSRAGASLHVAAVVPDLPFTARHLLPGDLQEVFARQRQDDLTTAVEYLRQRGVTAEPRLLTGKPALAVIEEVQRGGHELLFRPHRARTASGRVAPYGPIDMQLLRKCPVPVWLATSQPCRHILAALDPTGGPEHEPLDPRILDFAIRIAEVESASVTAVHAWELFGESLLRNRLPRPELKEYLRKAREESADAVTNVVRSLGARASNVQTCLLKGEPGVVIPKAAVDLKADLVVMGTLGRTGVPGYLIGNTAEAVVRQLRCSLVALKPAGFASPMAAHADARDAAGVDDVHTLEGIGVA